MFRVEYRLQQQSISELWTPDRAGPVWVDRDDRAS